MAETKRDNDSLFIEHQLKPTFQSVLRDKKLDSIINAFIKETPCDSCIHEMYIDKVLPNKIIITVKARAYVLEYLNGKNPLFTNEYNGILFYLYCGLEDLFIGDKKLMNYTGTERNVEQGSNWLITIDSNKYIVDKTWAIPFFPPTAPKIKIKE